MGLDLNPLPKPKPGFDAEFEDLWRRIEVAKGRMQPTGTTSQSFLKRLFSKSENIDALHRRFEEISIPHFESIGAPVVGRDPEADRWLEEHLAAKIEAGEMSLEQAHKNMDGYFVLQIMPECDGFPVYTHAYLYEGVDRASFRGEFLKDCGDVIDEDMLNTAWQPMLDDGLREWGEQLRAAADSYAEERNVTHVLGVRNFQWETETGPEAQAHIADQAARWARYWSGKGHGSEPFF